MANALIMCPCGAKNRIPLGKRVRCSKCKREFQPRELAKAVVERVAPAYELEREEDTEGDASSVVCKHCDWEGDKEDLDDDGDNEMLCPDCGSPVTVPKEDE